MRKTIALLFVLVVIVPSQTHAQGRKVDILKIEVDSKPISADFQLFIHQANVKIAPRRQGRSFEVPQDLGADPVSVQILFKEFDLWFSSVYPSKFTTNWIVGVDKKPFDTENLAGDNPSDIDLIYYLQFISESGDGTELVVTRKKGKNSK